MRRHVRAGLWHRFLRYGYPITAAYIAIMTTVIVVLLITDPHPFTCNC